MIARLPGQIRRLRPDVLFRAGSTYTVVAVAMKLRLGDAGPPMLVKISNDVARRDLPGWMRAPWSAWLRFQARFVDHRVVMEDKSVSEIRRALGDVAITDAQPARLIDPALEEQVRDFVIETSALRYLDAFAATRRCAGRPIPVKV